MWAYVLPVVVVSSLQLCLFLAASCPFLSPIHTCTHTHTYTLPRGVLKSETKQSPECNLTATVELIYSCPGKTNLVYQCHLLAAVYVWVCVWTWTCNCLSVVCVCSVCVRVCLSDLCMHVCSCICVHACVCMCLCEVSKLSSFTSCMSLYSNALYVVHMAICM